MLLTLTCLLCLYLDLIDLSLREEPPAVAILQLDIGYNPLPHPAKQGPPGDACHLAGFSGEVVVLVFNFSWHFFSLTLANSEYFGTTFGAYTLRSRLSVLHLDGLRILDLNLLSAFHAVSFHLFTSI